MSKVTLEFDLETESDELKAALKGSQYKVTIDELWDNLFRPRHKFGYPNQMIQVLLDGPHSEVCEALMDLLEQEYKNTVNRFID